MSNFKYLVAIIFTIGLFFLMTFRAFPGNPDNSFIMSYLREPGKAFESSQERARYSLIESIVDGKTLRLDKYAELSLPDISYKDGHYYSVFMPGLSIISIPAYIIGKMVGHPIIFTFTMPIIFTILAAVMTYFLSLEFSKNKFLALLAAIIFSLCTISWNYSMTFYVHTFSSLCLVSIIFFSLRAKNRTDFNYLMTWFFYGLGILLDYPNAIILFPPLFYLIAESFWSDKTVISNQQVTLLKIRFSFVYTIIPFLIFLAIIAYYNIHTFGSWQEIAHNYRVTQLVNNVPNYHFTIKNIFDLNNLQNGIYTLLFSKSRGLIIFSPILIFSIFGFMRHYKNLPKATILLGSCFIINLLVYASFYDPWGGWSYGPRYLIVSMPILAIMAAQSYEYFKKRIISLIAYATFFFGSFAVSLLGALTTNMLPPAAEVGKQVSFTSAINFIRSGSSSLILSEINKYINLTAARYYSVIFAVFLMIFLPLFLFQFYYILVGYFQGIKKINLITLFKRRPSVNV